MKKPSKVIMEATADGFGIKVLQGEEVLSERTWILEGMSTAKATNSADIWDDFPQANENDAIASLVGEVDMLLPGPAFDIASTLRSVRENDA